jgi:hypothetical protein
MPDFGCNSSNLRNLCNLWIVSPMDVKLNDSYEWILLTYSIDDCQAGEPS